MIKLDMSVVSTVFLALLFVNTVAAFITVFRKPRSIASVFAWMMTLVFIPGFGFLLYLFCGRGIDGEIIYKFSEHHQSRINELNQIIKVHNYSFPEHPYSDDNHLLERYFKNLDESPLTKGNQVQFYTDGKEKFAALFSDMQNAEDNIHVEYYSFFNDEIGGQFLDVLIEKAKQGVEVRLIFDPWGSPKANRKFFQPLMDAGGKVVPFITSKNLIRNTRLNYHLHRKIVVIDGQIGWTGGFNVGDQYLGKKAKFGYWRDNHLRILGPAVYSLQNRFLMDWNSQHAIEIKYEAALFPMIETNGTIAAQVVTSGPDSEHEEIKITYLKMINLAKKEILIQTPYYIPDESIHNALKLALLSGVSVHLQIPNKPDHPLVYWATYSFAAELLAYGAVVETYEKGFMHAKTMIVDSGVVSIGSANIDVRSFRLDFEVNTVVYDAKVAEEARQAFFADSKDSEELTLEKYRNRRLLIKVKEGLARLVSPLL